MLIVDDAGEPLRTAAIPHTSQIVNEKASAEGATQSATTDWTLSRHLRLGVVKSLSKTKGKIRTLRLSATHTSDARAPPCRTRTKAPCEEGAGGALIPRGRHTPVGARFRVCRSWASPRWTSVAS